jgi:tetratricopeptide (TPR) repeat protein
MNEGILQLNKNNMSGAERAMSEAIKADPSHAEAHLNLGKLYRKQQKWVDAEKAFRGAIDNSENPKGEFYFELGSVQVAQSMEPGTSRAEQETKWNDAIKSFTDAIGADPNLYKAHYQAGTLHEKLDQPEQADEAYRQCITIHGKYSPCYVSLGNMYIDYGFSNVAMAVLETGTKVNDTDADMWNGMGRALLALNRPKKLSTPTRKPSASTPRSPTCCLASAWPTPRFRCARKRKTPSTTSSPRLAIRPSTSKRPRRTRSCACRARSELDLNRHPTLIFAT